MKGILRWIRDLRWRAVYVLGLTVEEQAQTTQQICCSPNEVVEFIDLEVLDTGEIVETEFYWHTDDPLAVILSFHCGKQWLIGREVLADGQWARSGAGDVIITPMGSMNLHMVLRGEEGSTGLVLKGMDLNRFLTRTYAIVPVGKEVYEMTPADQALMKGEQAW
jgi:hypothetical protein